MVFQKTDTDREHDVEISGGTVAEGSHTIIRKQRKGNTDPKNMQQPCFKINSNIQSIAVWKKKKI